MCGERVGEAIARNRSQYATREAERVSPLSTHLTASGQRSRREDPLDLFAAYLKEKGVASDLHVNH
jgi:hypothetical protein